MVIDGYNGCIVPDRNPLVIAEKIKLLIENMKLKKQMDQRSILIVQDKYTLHHSMNCLREVFDNLLFTEYQRE